MYEIHSSHLSHTEHVVHCEVLKTETKGLKGRKEILMKLWRLMTLSIVFTLLNLYGTG